MYDIAKLQAVVKKLEKHINSGTFSTGLFLLLSNDGTLSTQDNIREEEIVLWLGFLEIMKRKLLTRLESTKQV